MNPYAPLDSGPLSQHRRHRHHQQSRYADLPSSPRPPNRSNLSDNPNLYAPQTLHHYHQHSRHLPPEVRHPPPAYHPSSTPPHAVSSPLPQYEFVTRRLNLVSDDRDRRLAYHHHQHHQRALVDSARQLLGGHNSPMVENRAELLDRRQNIGDKMGHRLHSGLDWNPEVLRRAVEHRAASPYGQVDSSRRESDSVSRVRLREDYAEEFGCRQPDDLLHGSFRRLASVAGSYESERHRSERGDSTSGNHSWVHSRENTRELGDSFSGSAENGVSDGKDFGTVALRQEYHSSELGRYSSSNRSIRELVREFGPTPKKQLQKKSAFLRLQMPRSNHRNRENDRHYSSNCHDDSASGSLSFKGKGQGQFSCSDHGPKDRGENRPVDLDVSFKSNTLIAKPIVPPSSSRLVLERDFFPPSKKLKSAIVSDQHSTSSLLDKLNQNDGKLSSLPGMVGVAFSTNKNAKQLHERIGESDAQYKGNLGCLEGKTGESDDLVKSDSCSLPVLEVTNVSSATNEVGKSNRSLVIDKVNHELQCGKDTVPEPHDSKVDIKRDMVFNKVSIGSTQGKTEGVVLPCKGPSVKDAIPDRQDPNAGPKRDVASSKDGNIVCSDQDKTEDKALPGKSHLVKDEVPEKQDSSAGSKRDVVSDDDGKNGGSGEGRTAEKWLPDAVPKGRGSKVGAKMDMIFNKPDKSIDSTRGNTADKVLPCKDSVEDAIPECQDPSAGPKRDVVSSKDGKIVCSDQDKTEDNGLPGKAHLVKDEVPEIQDSSAGSKRDVVSDDDGKNGGSGEGRTAEKWLPDAVPKGRGSKVGTKMDMIFKKPDKSIDSTRGNTADKVLPCKDPLVKDAIPDSQDPSAGPKRDVVSSKYRKIVASDLDKAEDKGFPGKAHLVKDAVTEKQDSSAGSKRDVLSDNDGINGGSGEGRTAEKRWPDAVPERQVSKVGTKRDMVFNKVDKSIGSNCGNTAGKVLPCKALVSDAIPDGQDPSAGPKRDVVSFKDDNIVGSNLDKTEKGFPRKDNLLKGAVSDKQDSSAGSKRDMVSDNDGKSGGSSEGRTSEKGLPDAAHEGQDSKVATKRDMVFRKLGRSIGSSQHKTAEKVLPCKVSSVKDAIPEHQDPNARPKRDVVSSKDGKIVVSYQDKTEDKGLPGKVYFVNDDVPEKQDCSMRSERDLVSNNGGRNYCSSTSRTAEKGVPIKASSIKVAKKKKIVKKVVKKVVMCRIDPLNRQTHTKHDGPVKAGNDTASATCIGSGSLKQEIKFSSVALSQDCGPSHDSNEAGLLQHIDQMKGASHSILSQRGGREDKVTDVLCDNDNNKCSSSLCPRTCEETKLETLDVVNSAYDLQVVSSSVKDLTMPLAQAAANLSMYEFNGQLLQDAKHLLLENQAEKDHLAGDSSTMGPSSSGGSNVHNGSAVLDRSLLRGNAALGPEEDLVGSLDLPILSGKESIVAAKCDASHPCQVTGVLREDSQTVMEAGACGVSGSSAINSEENVTGLSFVLSHNARRQLPQVVDPWKLDHGRKENPGSFFSALEDSKDCAPAPNLGRSHDEISQVDPVSSREADISAKTVDITCSGPSHKEARVLNFSMEDPYPAVTSSLGGLTAGSSAIACGHNASHGRESDYAAQAPDINTSVSSGNDLGDGRTSPAPRKRRKVRSPNRGSCDARVSPEDESAVGADRTTSDLQVQSTSWDSSAQPDLVVPGPSDDALLGSASVSSQEETGVLLKDNSQVGRFDAIDSTGSNQLASVHSSSCLGQSVIANRESQHQLLLEGSLEENFPAVSLVHDHENLLIFERSGGRKMDLDLSEKQSTSECESLEFSNPEIDFQISTRKFSPSNIENDATISLKDESPCISPYLSVPGGVDRVYASNTNEEPMISLSNSLSERNAPESLHNGFDAQISDGRVSPGLLVIEGVKKNLADHEENVAVRCLSVTADSALTSGSHDNSVDYSLDHFEGTNCTARNKTVIFPSNGSTSMSCSTNTSTAEPYGRMNRQSHVVRRAFPGHLSSTTTNSRISSSNSTSKPNTWRRTHDPSAAAPGNKPPAGTLPAKRPFPGMNEKLQYTSYVRKGNSLVRKPVADIPQTHLSHGTVPLYRLNSSDVQDLKKSMLSGSADDNSSLPLHLRTGGGNVSLAKPQRPPPSSSDDLPNSSTVHSASLHSFQAANPPDALLGGPVSDPTSSSHNDMLKPCEDARRTSEIHQDQTVSVSNSGSHNDMEDDSFIKRMPFVKRKSNQLVATVSDSDLASDMVDKMQGLPSKGYYKRKRNQLIRTSLDSGEQQLSDKANMERPQGSKATSCDRRRLLKAKLRTPLKSSSVWTLRGTLSDFSASNCEKIFPQLFPWKRATHWRNFTRNSAAGGDHRSLSAISKRLMLLRKRDTVYVRSSHGLSLRKSKVVSVDGRSLKWSKSIERQTKKASEEATRAVAAAEKQRRQQSPFGSVPKSKSRSLRERIFRIGNVRYKMDSSRKTLIRISDDESSLSAASQQGTDEKKSYVPKRLVIGNNEYVRIGNGNQLIRNPKKRTRVLANEKVKWSLHTARLKLAKKRKYCQFFTRFGKCNKGDGKCPYIHDPSKIAVCTKILSGSCSNKDCKLTHKVIPERMPDCSYFLQGLCTNRNCPYRHVNVNPKSSTCEEFLKGYCADGDECRKKHSYACPIFESTGNCHLGSKCKRHHPKSRTKGKKRKRSKEKKNTTGRYFGGSTYAPRAFDLGPSVTKKNSGGENSVKDNRGPFEGDLADYISLNYTDDEEGGAEWIAHAMGNEANDDLDMEWDDIAELIKPIAIM